MFNKHDHGHLSEKELMFLMFDFLISKIDRIVMTNEELAKGLSDLNTQLGKVNTEITGKIADLEKAIKDADNVPQTVVDAFNLLKPATQALDDIVPDAPVAPPAETPAP